MGFRSAQTGQLLVMSCEKLLNASWREVMIASALSKYVSSNHFVESWLR